MKITHHTLIAVLSSLPVYAQQYIAEGINLDNIESSTHFYDSGKGMFWAGPKSNPSTPAYDGVTKNLDGTKTLSDLLGDLSGELLSFQQNATYNFYNHYETLAGDTLSCWYQSGANVVEYWQQTYGVFAEKSAVSGYTYDKQYLSDFQGTQSLDLTYLFYKNMNGNETGSVGTAIDWYLAGSKGYFDAENFKDGVSAADGGYFSKYFSPINPDVGIYYSASQVQEYASTNSTTVFADRLATSLGYTNDGDGTYSRSEKGTIASVLLRPSEGTTNHYVTCYGFELTEDGNAVILYLADSDDEDYNIIKVYAKHDGSSFKLYSDENGDIPWVTFNKDNWTFYQTFSINTPESLKDLEESYSKSSNAQIWSGGSTEWGGTDESDDGGAATYASGWVRYATTDVDASLNGHFYSKLDSARAVVFNDYIQAGESTVSTRSIDVVGTVSAPSILIDSDQIAYRFNGASNTIKAASLTKEGTNRASFVLTTLEVATVALHEGSLELSDSSVTGNINVATGAQLHISGTTSQIGETLTLNAGSDLSFENAGDKLIVKGDLIIDKNFHSQGTTIGTVAVQGKLKVTDVSISARTLFSAEGATSTEALLQANLDLTGATGLQMDGALALGGDLLLSSDNKLTLDFSSIPSLDGDNYLMLFTDIGELKVNGVTASEGTDYFQFFELSAEAQAALGADATMQYDEAAGRFYIEGKAVPEPSSGALTLLALSLGLGRRRRRA